MELNLSNNDQNSIVEKVSKKDIKKEQAQISLEENNSINNLIKVASKLSLEDLKRAVAFVNKKIELLRNKK